MQKFAKLFVLALCLTLAGSVWAGKTAKGPLGAYLKHGQVDPSALIVENSFTLPEVGTRRPGSLDEVIISENFDALTPGTLPDGWIMVDVDNANCSDANWPFDQSEWTALGAPFVAHSGTNSVGNVYNDGAVPNNDWLILPQQNLTGTITLTFWSASQQAEYPETFAVKVSTTGTEPANFTNTLQTFANISTTWTEHTIDLSAYAGAPFYVAFHHTSVDMWILKIDDVLLEAGAAGPQGTIAGNVIDAVSGDPIEGVTVDAGPSTTTDASGDYSLLVNVGTVDVTFTAEGYEVYTESDVTVTEGVTTTVDAVLTLLPETNDDCASPAPLTVGDTDYSTADATTDPTVAELPASCDEGFGLDFTNDIWFSFVSPGTGDVEISTCNQATYDSRLAVYYAGSTTLPVCPTNNDDFHGCNDDGAGCTGFTSILEFEVVGGDAYLVRVGGFGAQGTGTLTVTFDGVNADDAPSVPTQFAMNPAFPNPFNPSTQISFDVPVTTEATLNVFNSLGQKVATLVNGQVTAGSHTVEFVANDLPSGLYFAQLTAGSFVSTQKLVLMK